MICCEKRNTNRSNKILPSYKDMLIRVKMRYDYKNDLRLSNKN